MTALAHQLQQPVSPFGQSGLAQPRLKLVPPYLEPSRPTAAVFLRRRLVALVVLITLMVGAWSLAGMGLGLVSSRTTSSAAITGQSSSSPAAQPQVWTVRPGDTLWSIARALKPTGDIQPVLMPLIKQYQGKPLTVGQTIQIPSVS